MVLICVVATLAVAVTYLAMRGVGEPGRTVESLQTLIGRQFSGERIYTNMAVDLPASRDRSVQSAGWLDYHDVNSWHLVGGAKICYAWGDIAAGRYDAWWFTQAQSIKAWGYPMYLSFMHEPSVNQSNHPQCGTPAEYVAAYDHLVQLFVAQGVANVTWVWTLTASAFAGAKGGPKIWEPAGYDVVGVDGYNHAIKWRTPRDIFQAAEAFASSRGKPLLIGEIGSDEQVGSANGKADWITQAAALFQSWGDVRAVMWTNTGNGGNYWLDSSSESLAAFTAAGRMQYYSVRSDHFVDGGAIWGIYSRG